MNFIRAEAGTEPAVLIENPSWEQVLEVVDSLDGERYSVVTMGAEPDSPPWLQVCGGDHGLVMCQYMWDELDGFQILLNPEGSRSDRVSLTIGGQTTDNWTMDALHPIKAISGCVQYFYDHGEMSPDHSWDG